MKLIGGDIQQLYTGYFNEAANLIGTDIFYEPLDLDEANLYDDKNITYLPKLQISILLQQHPTIRTLKTYGWYKNDEDSNPIIAYFPIDLKPKVHKNARIHIESHIGNRIESFEIDEITQHYTYPSHWICKLKPYVIDDSVMNNDVKVYPQGQYVPKPK